MFLQVPSWWPTFLVAAALLHAGPPRRAAGAEPAPPTDPDTPRWAVVAADCEYVVQSHQIDGEDRSSESLRLRAGPGTYVYARQTIASARLIDDLQVGVWIDANRRGLQVLGQIVLPDTLDPDTGRRATVLVAGEAYESVGRWQRLQLTDIPQKFERQVRVLRARLRQPIDTRRAYLEAVVVNVFGGPGTTDLRIGRLELTGNLPIDSAWNTDIATVGYSESQPPPAPPQRRSSRLIIEGRPFFPRVIEYQGESLALLKQLGFNTISFPEAPSDLLRQQARELGLWLILPPPADELAGGDDLQILGWFLGKEFTPAEFPPDYIDRLRRRDPLRRPLIAGVNRERWQASRELDILLHCREPLGSSFELSHFGPWLDQLNQLARPGTPFWSLIQTELNPQVIAQVQTLANVEASLPGTIQAEQLRQLALASVAAGARGLWFQSRAPLDRTDPTTQLRRLMLELVNAELVLVEPWAMGGQRVGEVPCDNAELRVVALGTERSRLLIPTRVQAHGQFVCRPITGGNTLVIAGVSDSTDVYQLSHVGLTSLKKERITGGLRIKLDEESADSLLLLTEDPLVMTHTNQVVGLKKRVVVARERELAERRLAELENGAARKLLETRHRVELWEVGRQALKLSRDLGEADDLTASFRFAQKTNRVLDQLEADLWRELASTLSTPLGHPSAATFSLAVASDRLQSGLPIEAPSAPNRLEAGECEDLNRMVAAGWRQHQVSPADVETYVALSPREPHEGRFCLRMLASARTPDAEKSVVEFAPVWINSPPVTVRPGDRVHISGWIRIDQPIRGSYDGCVISDSVSGPPLALRYRRNNGWQRFEMTRAVTRHDHLTVLISLHGLGEVWIDDLQVRVEPPLASENAVQISRNRSSIGQ